MRLPSFKRIATVVTVASVLYLAFSFFITPDPSQFFHEGHGVEELSLGLLPAGVALWILLAGHHRWREWQIPAALLLMMAREMDFDKRFTEHGLLKLTTYTQPAPVMTKLVGGIAILFTLWVMGRLLRRNLPVWWVRLKGGTGDAWMILVAGLCGVLAKTFDGLGRKLLDLGIHIPGSVDMLAGRSEEVLEAVCYYLIVLSIARLAAPAVRAAAGLRPA
ncbi:hypothetical protein [Falsirhodobacter sp. 20TX0035]|uniref:hypothetical protein n=1 Tax=Falsirhodobacter sp. 20TX0035 TaxID=3022019 RepID=UPI00232D115F|nr:hypothetical protein [Falsirhodobacter sp. 20TX0035]MDB6452206.1 hypothetical protein [Falsirhodobacter sp. 20TX0035]